MHTTVAAQARRIRGTIANRIASTFGWDGMRWVNDRGIHLDDAIEAEGGERRRHPVRPHIEAWDFPDGSTIVVRAGRWDIGYQGCFCGTLDGHLMGCPCMVPSETAVTTAQRIEVARVAGNLEILEAIERGEYLNQREWREAIAECKRTLEVAASMGIKID